MSAVFANYAPRIFAQLTTSRYVKSEFEVIFNAFWNLFTISSFCPFLYPSDKLWKVRDFLLITPPCSCRLDPAVVDFLLLFHLVCGGNILSLPLPPPSPFPTPLLLLLLLPTSSPPRWFSINSFLSQYLSTPSPLPLLIISCVRRPRSSFSN